MASSSSTRVKPFLSRSTDCIRLAAATAERIQGMLLIAADSADAEGQTNHQAAVMRKPPMAQHHHPPIQNQTVGTEAHRIRKVAVDDQ